MFLSQRLTEFRIKQQVLPTKSALCQRREPDKREDRVYSGDLILPQVVLVWELHYGNNPSLASWG